LPRIEVIHELLEEERQCDCGCLKAYSGQEVSEQLDFIPAIQANPGDINRLHTAIVTGLWELTPS
jgi:transposase